MEGNRRFRSSSGRPSSGKRKPFKKRDDAGRTSSDGDRFSKPKGDFKPSDKPFEGRAKSFKKRSEGGQGFKQGGGSYRGDRPFSKPGKRSFSSGPGKFSKSYSKGPGGERSGPPGKFSKPYPKGPGGERSDTGKFSKPYSKGPGGERSGPGKFNRPYSKGPGGERSNPPGKFEGGRPKGSDDRFSSGKPPRKDSFRESPRHERKSFVDSRVDKQRMEGQEKAPASQSGEEMLRLNKFISNSGVCSRREADDLIIAGLITVNGKPITELGFKVKRSDDVRYDGKRLKAEMPVYILLNKPKGYITTTDDPQERKTVMQLIQGACKERVYPVGRLDRNTSGLLLLTNDGDLTEKLSHPSHNIKKIYKAELDRPLTKSDFQKILEGVRLEEGKAVIDDLAIISDDGKTIGLEIHIGWNRLVRRIFEAVGYEVTKLDRSSYATLTKKELSRGHWRFLRPDEVIRLKHFL